MVDTNTIPKEFRQIIKDFLRDLFTSFPEYKDKVSNSLLAIIETDEEPLESLFAYVKKIFPERFFDILYKNNDIFSDETKNTEFLPGIQFSEIWEMNDVSDTIRETIWNYLQLVMFSVLETIESQDSFGETAKLFEAINEDELKNKIQETVENMKEMFSSTDNSDSTPTDGINLEDLPNADSVHEHLNGLLEGTLGKLASEIAEDVAKDFDMDLSENADVGEMFKKMFKNPGKLMGLVNTISTKLDNKLKNGEINEVELMKEAGNLINKTQNMGGGMPDIADLMSKLGGMGGGMPDIADLMSKLGGMGGGMPDIADLMKGMNIPKKKEGLVKQKLNANIKGNSTKVRLQKKLEARRHNEELALNELKKDCENMVLDKEADNMIQSIKSKSKFDGKSFCDGTDVKRTMVEVVNNNN